jgi:hypothetical protein
MPVTNRLSGRTVVQEWGKKKSKFLQFQKENSFLEGCK